MEFNSKNFAIWMVLKEMGKQQYNNGLFKSDSWSIYGGYRQDESERKSFAKKYSLNNDSGDFLNRALGICVHKIGIDYEQTSAPESANNKQLFNGTFAEPDYVDYLIGDLILKDGTVVPYAIESIIDMNQFDNFVEFMEYVKEQNATS